MSTSKLTEETVTLLRECHAAILEANRNGYVRGHPLLARLNETLSPYRTDITAQKQLFA